MLLVNKTEVTAVHYAKHIIGTGCVVIYNRESKRMTVVNHFTKEIIAKAPVPLTLEEFEMEAKDFMLNSINYN